jgi:hypothetical protein
MGAVKDVYISTYFWINPTIYLLLSASYIALLEKPNLTKMQT